MSNLDRAEQALDRTEQLTGFVMQWLDADERIIERLHLSRGWTDAERSQYTIDLELRKKAKQQAAALIEAKRAADSADAVRDR